MPDCFVVCTLHATVPPTIYNYQLISMGTFLHGLPGCSAARGGPGSRTRYSHCVAPGSFDTAGSEVHHRWQAGAVPSYSGGSEWGALPTAQNPNDSGSIHRLAARLAGRPLPSAHALWTISTPL